MPWYKSGDAWTKVVTVGCLIVVAVIEAAEQALSGAPHLAAMLPHLAGGWHFLPLILLSIAGLSWLLGYWRKPKTTDWRKPKTTANASANALSKVQVHREDSEGEAVKYKWKVRTVIKNETGKTVTVARPVWVANGGEVSLELPPKMMMQIERVKGGWRSDQWFPEEYTQLQVPPDFAFRTWIGLHEKLSDRDFGRLQENEQFGTLSLSVDGFDVQIPV
jgi:hypothetical protein